MSTTAEVISALAAVVQALFAILIWIATNRYVSLTDDLKNPQAEVVRLQKQAVARELYDRRVKVYDALMAFLAVFAQDVKVGFKEIRQL